MAIPHISEIFAVYDEKSYDEYLLDQLNQYLLKVEASWGVLLEMDSLDWNEYREALQSILIAVTLALSFIEDAKGPDVIMTLYGEIQSYLEERIRLEQRVTQEDFAKIQHIIASLGVMLQPDVLELGLIEQGELEQFLTDQLLQALDQFSE